MQAVHTCGMRIHTGTYHSCPYGNSMKFKLSRSSKASPRGLPWWICASSWPRLKNWVEPRQKHVLEPLKLVFLSHFFCWHFRVCALLYLAEAACDTCTHLVCLHLPFSHKMLLASSCETWEYWSTSFRMFQLSICHEAIWHKQQAMLFEPKSCQKHHILASIDSIAEPGHTFLCKVSWWALKLQASVVRDCKEKWSRRERAMEQAQRIQESFYSLDHWTIEFFWAEPAANSFFDVRTPLPCTMQMKMAFCRSRRSSNIPKACCTVWEFVFFWERLKGELQKRRDCGLAGEFEFTPPETCIVAWQDQ